MPFEKGTFIVPNEGNPDYVKSSRERFRFRWAVAGEYEIKNGILVPKRMTGWRESYPAIDENLPLHLAKIEEGDEKALLAFARRNGILGSINLLPVFPTALYGGKLLTEEERLSGQYALPLGTEKEQRAHVKRDLQDQKRNIEKCCAWLGITDHRMREAWISTRGGDPLPWIWAHIRTLRICLELTYIIRNRDEEGVNLFLKCFLKAFPHRSPCPVLNVAILHCVLSYFWEKPNDQRKEAEQWTNIEYAKYVRRYLINENIAGIRIALEPVGKSEDSFFEYRSLIEMAYWHLHNIVIEGKLRRCKECRAFFVQRDKREQFCPDNKIKGQSYCGIKFRSRAAMRKIRREKKKRASKA